MLKLFLILAFKISALELSFASVTKCGVNEIYDICPPTCPPQRCDVDERVIRCAPNPKPGDKACKPGCRCIDNYKKDKSGICIPKEECPGIVRCGPNEIISSCVNGGCGRWNCSQTGEICVKLAEGACREGCHCKDSYLRADNGTCIPADECPLTCTGANEIIGCETACSELCDSEACTFTETAVCTPACRCKPGFCRNKDGECISKKRCPKNCGVNEIYDICPPTCPPPKCDVDEKVILCLPNPKPGDKACKPGCRCIDNYKQNESGVCIPKEECPPIPSVICGPDEVYTECANGGCGRWECSQQGQICIDLVPGGCVPGCRCAEPLLRADDGSCVPADQCPPVCNGQNEVAGCRSLCPETCESIGKNCTIIEAAVCIPDCRCKPGFYRNKIGDCISEEQCLNCTGPHEYFSCGSACDNVCATLSTENQTNCPIVNIVCNQKCYCEKNYARNCDNICIPIEECPINNCGVNELYDLCPPTCPPPRCDVDEKVTQCLPNPKPGDEACKPGCRCIDNYKQNASGVCIPKEECPPQQPVTCGPDEVYTECANGGCGRWECSQPGPLCIDLIEGGCVPGCRCAEPLLRADDGSCVPADQCPPICTGQNEVAGCRTKCPETCESIGKNCTIIEPAVCISDCRCKPGFYRNKIGDCISEEQCLNCTGPHEFFSCGSACDNVCSTLSTENQTNCPIVNIVCNQKCYCEENYARDSCNICIPVEECPNKENGIKKFTEGNVVFTENFLKVASKMNTGDSAIYSPFSLLFLLAQLALYATGISKQQLLSVLNLQNENLIRSTIPVYLDEFNSQKNVSLDLAERVYGNVQYKFSKKFLKDTKDIFKAEAQNLDFSKSSQAAKIINDWIALKTHDLIQNLVSPDTLDSNTRIVLVNAIYFKGNWKYPFKTEKTKQLDFYVNENNNVKVNMMNQIGSFNYAEIEKPNIQVLELPYENRNLSYLVCLPKSKDGIDELIDALGDPSFSALKTAISSLKSTRVDVSIPTMEITTTTNLQNVLRQLNVTAIFDPQTAGLSGMLEKEEQLFVSSATQKATIIVTETGTKAAAANAIIIRALAAQLPTETVKFNANHPYAYFILYQGTPIFSGIYTG